jgi:hypothetical protein
MSFSALGGAVLPFFAGLAIMDIRVAFAYFICAFAAVSMFVTYTVLSKAHRQQNKY